MFAFYAKVVSIVLILIILTVESSEAESNNIYGRGNSHAKSMTTPVAWGAKAGTAFASIGGTKPAPYTLVPDGAANMGMGFGNPDKYIGIQLGLVSLDLSGLARYAFNFKLTHHLNEYEAIAFGGENIVIQDSESPSDGKESYYFVYSKNVQNKCMINRKKKRSSLHYSIGIGNGKYREKSDYDIDNKRGRYGSAIFGNVSYGVFGLANVIADWNGLNMCVGVSKTINIFNLMKVGGKIGYADITENSGKGKRLVGGLSGSINF